MNSETEQLELPIRRKWFYEHENGVCLMDWGEGLMQNVVTTQYVRFLPSECPHNLVSQSTLEQLLSDGIIARYDDDWVVLQKS